MCCACSPAACDGRVGALSCFAFIEGVARGCGVWYCLGLFNVGPAHIYVDRSCRLRQMPGCTVGPVDPSLFLIPGIPVLMYRCVGCRLSIDRACFDTSVSI